MRGTFLLLAAGCGLITGSVAQAEDWAQWRGPRRDGISAEAGLLQDWPAEGPKLLWQVNDAGGGYSTPSVVGDRLFVMGNEGTDNEYVQARKVENGEILWTQKVGAVGPNRGPQYPGARSTPTADGDRLFALGSDGDLVCLDATSGDVVWKKQLRTEFGGVMGAWAYSESPLIDGDKLLCTPGGPDATILALNKNSGEVIWKCATPEADEAPYSSIVVLDDPTLGKQYVQFLQKGLVGVDAETGKLRWRYAKTAEGSPANIPTPVIAGNYIYSGASRSGGGLVKLVKNGDEIAAEEVFFARGLPTAIGGYVKLGDNVYGTNGQAMICMDFLTGAIKWQDRGVGPASVLFADGRIYVHGDNTGETALIEAAPDGYKEHGRFTPANPPDRGDAKAWAYPVLANGRLYLRDATSIWCYDVAK